MSSTFFDSLFAFHFLQDFIVTTAYTLSAYRCFGSGALVHAGFAHDLFAMNCAAVGGKAQQHAGKSLRQLDQRENTILSGEGRA